jgi:fumarate reductase subunit D
LFSIGTKKIPIHIKQLYKPVYILDFSIAKPVLKQLVEPICVLIVNLTIPLNTIKQHLLETFSHPEEGEMIIDETSTKNE